MGYDLHITRTESWVDSDQNPITADEWLALVEADNELQIDPENGPYFAIWSGSGSYPYPSWFDWQDGEIYSKSPRRRELAKMLQIARAFDARVQGDDGELYNIVEDMPADDEFERLSSRPWWRFW